MRWDVIGLVLGWTIRVVCVPLSVVGMYSFYTEGDEYAIKTSVSYTHLTLPTILRV